MKKVDNYFDDIPKNLKSKLVKTVVLKNILKTKRVEVADYNRTGVKEKLLEIYANCCAFCETRVGKYDDTEHFRPKHEVTNVNSTGYYWLGIEWSNFVIACKDCNGQDNKGNHFPISGIRFITPASVDFTDNQQVSTFLKACHIRSTELQAEGPLLLHPVLDNPDDYLIFEKNGTITPKNNQEKGHISIQIYGLSDWQKRPQLIQDRKQIVDDIRDMVHHAIHKYVNDDRLFEDLLDIHLALKRRIAEKKPFSAVRRTCLVHFKAFFVDEFTGIQAMRLNNAYDNLKKQLLSNKK